MKLAQGVAVWSVCGFYVLLCCRGALVHEYRHKGERSPCLSIHR